MFRPPSEDQSLRPRFTRRALLLGAAQVGLMAVIGNRLHELQIEQAKRLAFLAERNRLNLLPLAPTRGRILDVDGRPLADNAETFGVALIPDLVDDLEHALARLAQIIPIPEVERKRVIALARSQSRVLPIPLKLALTWDQFAEINVLAPQLPGLAAEIRHTRHYAEGDAMGHIVGFVGAVDRFELEGDPAQHLADLRVGKQGVEFGRDDILRGTGGLLRREVDARGRIIREIDRKQPKPGRDIQLTVDSGLQRSVLARAGREGPSAVVALEVATGRVVAMASTPSFDNTVMNNGVTSEDWRRMEIAPGKPLVDKTVRGQYPPGSTFKMVTALAGLEAGLIDPNQRVTCEGAYTLADHTFRCWNSGGHGVVNLHRALRESCNVYFYKLADQLGINRLAAMASRLGLGQTYPFDLAQQKEGLIPTPSWKLGNIGRPWLGGETVLAGIGQGFVLATPLQLAVMTARIAGGRSVLPTLTDMGAGDPDQAAATATSDQFSSLDIDDNHLAAVRRGMWAVVNEGGGTASVAALPLPGIAMAGKTGTAQVRYTRRRGKIVERQSHSVFVGFAPADSPKYAVAAIVEHGGGGSKRAAPLARDVMVMILAHEEEKRAAAVASSVGATALSSAPTESGPADPVRKSKPRSPAAATGASRNQDRGRPRRAGKRTARGG